MRQTTLLILLVGILGGCASVRWAELDDSPVPAPSSEESAFLEETVPEAVLFEDFNDSDLVEGISVRSSAVVDGGMLTLPEEGTWVTVALPRTATRIFACYRLESETGRICISTELREGRTEVFNDVLGDWAHNLDRITPYSRVEGFGYGGEREAAWVVQEMRVEENHVSFFRNGSRFGKIRLKGTTGFDSFCIKAETGARGSLDWILAI